MLAQKTEQLRPAHVRSVAPADAALRARLAAFLCLPAGRLVLVGVFTVMLAWRDLPFWWATGSLLALMSLAPQRRKALLAAAAVCWVALKPPVNIELLTKMAPERGAAHWLWAWPFAVAGAWLLA